MYTKLTGLLVVMAALAGCSGRVGADGSGAPAATPSGIAPAPPRALGPGAARMSRPTSTSRAQDPDELDEPLFPAPGLPDGGLGTPGGGPTEL